MKAKPILITLATLVIGFILGILVSGQVRYHKLKPIRVFFSEERFREGFYNTIQPDEKQKVTIDQILQKYAGSQGKIIDDSRKKMDSSMKQLWRELEPVLTKEQLERLRMMEQKRNEMYRQNRGGPHDTLNYRGRRGMPHSPEDRPPFNPDGRERSK